MRIMACLLGREIPGVVFDSWAEWLVRERCSVTMRRDYDPIIYDARNRICGGRGHAKRQVPFDSGYDYILCSDADTVFIPNDVTKLIEANKPIISGLCLIRGIRHFAVMMPGDRQVYPTPEMVKGRGVFPIQACGFGFVLIRRGVLETMDYPWFAPWYDEANNDYLGEDMSFCKRAREAGHEIWAHGEVVVGHLKNVVLRP